MIILRDIIRETHTALKESKCGVRSITVEKQPFNTFIQCKKLKIFKALFKLNEYLHIKTLQLLFSKIRL